MSAGILPALETAGRQAGIPWRLGGLLIAGTFRANLASVHKHPAIGLDP